jgi:hypothetical protein
MLNESRGCPSSAKGHPFPVEDDPPLHPVDKLDFGRGLETVQAAGDLGA